MPDQPNHLSQDDIDALIGDIAGPAPGAAKPDISAPSPAAAALIGQAKDPSHLPTAIAGTPHGQGQDDAENLLKNVQVSNEQASMPAPATNKNQLTKSLGQAEINALISQAHEAGRKSETPNPVPKSTHLTKSLGQDEIDAIINQVQDAGEKPGTSPQPKTSALTKSLPIPNQPIKTSHLTKSLAQDEIDALINQVQEASENPSTSPVSKGSGPLIKSSVSLPKVTTAPDKGAADKGGAGGRGIDHLLASVESQAHQKAQDQISGNASQDVSASGPLGQDDIDRLLAELGATTPLKGTTARTAKPSDRPATERSASRPTTSKTSATPVKQVSTTFPIPQTQKTTGGVAPTVALSAADLEALVTKQAGIESDHSEAPMIDQGDIDALVKQLANATGAPDTKRISDALAQHEGEIDKLLEKAADANATMDAVDVGRNMSPSHGGMAAAMSPSMAVVASHELRGTRWLLAAAVLFLGMCSATLIIVVNSINSLSHELHDGHHAALAPTDSFGDDLKAALSKLGSDDDGEVTKGVLFMQRLKIRHPSHLADIALTLARHFRAHGEHRQAIEEYTSLSDNANGPFDDPRIYLDYANSLVQVGEVPTATRQIYLLLANEEAYLGDHDRHGLARPADEIGRNRQAVQDAYLALGQLIVADIPLVKTPAPSVHPAATPATGHEEPAAPAVTSAVPTAAPAPALPATSDHAAPESHAPETTSPTTPKAPAAAPATPAPAAPPVMRDAPAKTVIPAAPQGVKTP